MLTYERIIKESSDFVSSHDQINSFGNGDLWEVIERNKFQDFVYPLLWLQDGTSSIQDKLITFNFNVLAIDQVLNGEVNENYVKSSMHQLLLDYLAYFDQTFLTDVDGNRIKFKITRTASLTSFTERFDDELTGWNMSVSFTTPFTYSKCVIPGVGAGTPNTFPIYWQLDFYNTDDIAFVPTTNFNKGTFTTEISSDQIGTLEISTDNITYNPFTLPFTPVVGTDYFFKRSTATQTGQYVMFGTYE